MKCKIKYKIKCNIRCNIKRNIKCNITCNIKCNIKCQCIVWNEEYIRRLFVSRHIAYKTCIIYVRLCVCTCVCPRAYYCTVCIKLW